MDSCSMRMILRITSEGRLARWSEQSKSIADRIWRRDWVHGLLIVQKKNIRVKGPIGNFKKNIHYTRSGWFEMQAIFKFIKFQFLSFASNDDEKVTESNLSVSGGQFASTQAETVNGERNRSNSVWCSHFWKWEAFETKCANNIFREYH